MIRKIPGFFLLLCVFLMAILNSGTVRRKQNPFSKSQTAGIKLKDKIEELKDGEKGPATPSFGWYGGKNGFMNEPPFNKDNESKPASTAEQVLPVVSEVEVPQEAVSEDEADSAESEEDWDEDWADDGGKEDEALPATADTEEDVDLKDSSTAVDTSVDKKASKWDKDWWDEI